MDIADFWIVEDRLAGVCEFCASDDVAGFVEYPIALVVAADEGEMGLLDPVG